MKEADIRPKKLYAKFIDLLNKEVSDKFKQAKFEKINCPACESRYHTPIFRKFGFSYCECRKCNTIFVNPMPEDQLIRNYYKDSRAIKFLAEEIYGATGHARKIKIFRPRAKIIKNLIRKYRLSNYVVLDIGGGAGFLADELRKINIKCQIIEPSLKLTEICLSKHIKTHNVFLEEFDFNVLGNKTAILTSFELVEHLRDPFAFLKYAFNGIKKGSFLLFTTLSGTGFDLRLLWDKSLAFIPPLHLVFFNPKSIEILLKRLGFEIIDISTPGQLDWNIVEERIKDDSAFLKVDKFWNLFAKKGNDKAKRELQKWISSNKFSSHMMVLARKP